MSNTEGPDTASTGTMNTTEAREQAVPAAQTSETLEYSSINSNQAGNTTSARRTYSRNTASIRSNPAAFCKYWEHLCNAQCCMVSLCRSFMSLHIHTEAQQ